MLSEELLKVIIADREREIAAAQRARSAKAFGTDERPSRTWLRGLWTPTPTIGGRPHPGSAAGTESGFASKSSL
jgi:hypothetical protein